MPAFVARRTAATDESAPALSRMIAAALEAMAASIRLSCRYASSSCASMRTRYPREMARAAAASASALKKGLSCDGTITTMSRFEVSGRWHALSENASSGPTAHNLKTARITLRLRHWRAAATEEIAPEHATATGRWL